MAQITASEVFRNRLLADGRRRIRYKYTVEDNQSVSEDYFQGPFHRPGDWDVDGNLAGYGTYLLERLKNAEDENVADPELKGNSLTIAQNPRWSTEKRISKKLIRWMMMERDPRIVIWLEPLINYLDANYTPTQLANWLDITIPQLQKMDTKTKAILNPPAVSASVKDQLLIADDNSEEIA